MLLLGVCACLAHWSARPLGAAGPDPTGINLQAGASSFKLNDTSARKSGHTGPELPVVTEQTPPNPKSREQPTPALEELPVPETALEPDSGPKETKGNVPKGDGPLPMEVAPPAPKPQEPFVPVPPVVAAAKPVKKPAAPPVEVEVEKETPVASAELAPSPVNAHEVLHQGDIPMTRSWKMLGLQTVLAVALTSVPVPAKADTESKKGKTDIESRLKNLEDGLKELQEGADSFADGLRRSELKLTNVEGKLKTLEKQVSRLIDALEALRKSLAPKGVTAAYPPDALEDIDRRLRRLERAVFTPRDREARKPAPVGRILLTNNFDDEITIAINRRLITLPPGTSRLLDGHPAGRFTYQVMWNGGTAGLKRRRLAANETFRITVD
jgi:hypothetical protein